MASTQATIDLVVRGSAAVNRLISDIGQLQGAVARINSQSLDVAPRELQQRTDRMSATMAGLAARANALGRQRSRALQSEIQETDRLAAAQRNQQRALEETARIERELSRLANRDELRSRRTDELRRSLRDAASQAEAFSEEMDSAATAARNLRQQVGQISQAYRAVSSAAAPVIDANQVMASSNAVRALAREYAAFGDSLQASRRETSLSQRVIPGQIASFRRLGEEIEQAEVSLQSLREELSRLGARETVIRVSAPTVVPEGELLMRPIDMNAQLRAAQTQQENALREQRNQQRTQIEQQIREQEAQLVELERQAAAAGRQAVSRQEELARITLTRTPRQNQAAGLSVSLNQIQAQAEALALVANNSGIASNAFNQFTVAAEMASIKLARSQQATFTALAGGFSGAMEPPPGLGGSVVGGSAIAGARGQVAELINMIPGLTRSEAALSAHITLLTKVQQLLPFLSLEYRAVEEAIRGLNEEIQDATAARNAPATRLGSLQQYKQQEAFRASAEKVAQRRQKESNKILSKFSDLYYNISEAQIDQSAKTRLLINSDRVIEALDQSRLETAKEVTRELERQLRAAENVAKAQKESARRGGPSLPVSGRLINGAFAPGSPLARREEDKKNERMLQRLLKSGPSMPVSGRLISGGFAADSPGAIREAIKRGGPSMPVSGRLVGGGFAADSPGAIREAAKRGGPSLPISGRLVNGSFVLGSPGATESAIKKGGPSLPISGRLANGSFAAGSPGAFREAAKRGGPALPVSGRLIDGSFAPGSPRAKSEAADNERRLKSVIRSGEIVEKSLLKLQKQDASVGQELIALQERLNNAREAGVKLRKHDVDILADEVAYAGKLAILKKKPSERAAGPSKAIDDLTEQRKYQRQVNEEYKNQQDLIEKIKKSALSASQAEKLSAGVGQARKALFQDQLEGAQLITREIEKQLKIEKELESERQKQRVKGVNWTTFLARGEEAIAENRDKAAAASKKEMEDAANARKNQLTKLETQLNNYTILEGKGVKFMEEKAELAKLVSGLSNNQIALTKQETEAIDELIKKFRLYSDLRVSQAKTTGTYKSGPSGKTQAEINEDRRERVLKSARTQEDRLLKLGRKGVDVADLRKGLEEQILNIQKLQGSATADSVREAAEALMVYRRAINDLTDSLSKSSKSGPGLEQALQKLREARGSREAFLAGASPAVAIDKIVREFNSGGESADDAGKNIAETFANSLEAGTPAAAAAAKKMAEGSTDAINKEFGINSPARFMIELVQNLVTTYVRQLAQATPVIEKATRKAFSIDREALEKLGGREISEKTSKTLLDASAEAGAKWISTGSDKKVSTQQMAGFISKKGRVLDPSKLEQFLGEKTFKAAENQLSTRLLGAEFEQVQGIYKKFYGIGEEAEKAAFSAEEIEAAVKNLTSGLDIIATLVQASADLTKKFASSQGKNKLAIPLGEIDPSVMAGQAKAFGGAGFAGMSEAEWSEFFNRIGGVPDFNKLFSQQDFFKIKRQTADPELENKFKSILSAETGYTVGSIRRKTEASRAPELVSREQPNIFSRLVEQAKAAVSAAIPKTAQEQIPAAYGTSPERMARLYGNARGQGAGRFGISEEQWLAGFKKIGMVPDFEKMFGKEQWSLVEQGNDIPEIENKIKSIILGAASKAAKEIIAGSSSLTTIPGQAQIAGAGEIVAEDDKQRRRIEEAYRRSAERQAAIMAEDTAMRIAGKSLVPAPAAQPIPEVQPAQAAQQIQEKTAIGAEVKKTIDSVFTDIGIAAKNGVKKIQESKVGQAIDSISSSIGTAADKASQKIKKTEAGKAFDFVADKTKKGADAAAAKIKQIKAKEAFDFIANKVDQGADAFFTKIKSAASGAGGGFGAGGGTRPPSGGGPGGPGGQKDPEEFARRLDEATKKGAEALLGLEELRDPTKASINEIEALSAVLKEFRAVLDPTAKGFDRLDAQLRETIAKIDREGQVRAPDAGFLTRFTRDPRKANAISEGLIGGAFPLLFGQGIGASIFGGLGGFAGGFAGGGLGFGLSLIGTALGTAFDTAVQSAKELGAALQKPVESFDKLAEKSFFSSRALEQQIRKTIESGNTALASAAIQQEAVRRVGVDGVKNLRYLETQSDRLNRAWAAIGLQIQALIAGPLASLLDVLSKPVERDTLRGRGEKTLEGLSPELQKEFNAKVSKAIEDKIIPQLEAMDPFTRFFSTLSFEEPKNMKNSRGPRASVNYLASLDPKALEKILNEYEQFLGEFEIRPVLKEIEESQLALYQKQLESIDVGKNITDQIRNAAREQQDLDKQRAEIVESYEESIGGIRKQVEDEIANRRLAIIEKENSLLELQAENRIKEFEQFAKTSIEKAGAGKPKEIEDIAKKTAEVVLTFLTEQLSAEEKAAKIKRDAALEAKKLDFEALNFKIEVEKQVSKLNIDTAKQIRQINEQTRRRNEDYDQNKFQVEKKIAEIQLKRILAEIDQVLTAYDSILRTIPEDQKILHKNDVDRRKAERRVIAGSLAEIKSAKPPARLREIAPVGGGTVSTTGIDSLVNTQRDQITRQTAEMLRSVDFAYANSEEALASGIAKISAEILAPLKDLGVAMPSDNKEALQVSNKITENEQRQARYSQLINQGHKESIANKIIEVELAGKLATAQYDAAIQQLRSQEYYDEALKTQRALLNNEIEALKVQKRIPGITEERRKEIDGNIAAITKYSGELGTVIRTNLDSQAVLLERAKAGIPGAIQLFTPQLIQKERRNEIEDFVNQAISSLNDLEATAIRVSQGIGNAVGDSFGQLVTGLLDGTATGKEIFANFLKSVAEILAKEAVSIISTYTAIGIARIFAGLTGGGSAAKGAQSIGAAAGSSFNDFLATGAEGIGAAAAAQNANGNAYGGPLMPFAMGGAFANSIVSAPTLFKFADGGAMRTGLMGEAGPEAIMPLTRGPGGRLGVDASGTGGDVYVNVTVDASGSKVQGDEALAGQLGRVVAAAVQQELVKQKRPGGILA